MPLRCNMMPLNWILLFLLMSGVWWWSFDLRLYLSKAHNPPCTLASKAEIIPDSPWAELASWAGIKGQGEYKNMLIHHHSPGSFLLLPPYTGFQPPANNTKNHCIILQLFLGKYLNFRCTLLLLTLTLHYPAAGAKTHTPVPTVWALGAAGGWDGGDP